MNEILILGFLVSFILIGGLFAVKGFADDSAQPQKKLIEFGWDEPGTEFMREHITEMEHTSFDGCVFHVNYKKEDGSNGSFTWECWGQ